MKGTLVFKHHLSVWCYFNFDFFSRLSFPHSTKKQMAEHKRVHNAGDALVQSQKRLADTTEVEKMLRDISLAEQSVFGTDQLPKSYVTLLTKVQESNFTDVQLVTQLHKHLTTSGTTLIQWKIEQAHQLFEQQNSYHTRETDAWNNIVYYLQRHGHRSIVLCDSVHGFLREVLTCGNFSVRAAACESVAEVLEKFGNSKSSAEEALSCVNKAIACLP